MAILESAPPGAAYQLRLIGRQEGTETNNVLHFIAPNGDSDVETHLVVVMVECFIDNLLPALSQDWALIEARWKQVFPALGVEHIYTPPAPAPGGAVANAFPSYVSALTSIRTLEGGRSKRGRMFIAGVPKDAADNSRIDDSSSFWSALVDWLACIATNFIHTGGLPGADQWNMAVYSRKIGGSTIPYGAAGFTSVASLVGSLLLSTTRSRKLGIGS